MENEVKVTIDRSDNVITVSNDKGGKWEFFCEGQARVQASYSAFVASVAVSMMIATISSHLKHNDDSRLVYTLNVEND